MSGGRRDDLPRPDEEQARLLEYLQGLGFEDLILPREGAGGSEATTAGRPRAPIATGDPPPTAAPPRPVGSAVAQALAGGASSAAAAASRTGSGAGDLEVLALEAAGCTRCRLADGRKTVVFADGDPAAELMFIGEGPGAEEDRRGLPFVGPAGQLLDRIIEAMGMRREQVYIANIVKCRPPGNRDPHPDEVSECIGYLERQIDLVAPRVLVALGRVAAQTLLGTDTSLGRLRGTWHEVRGVPLRVTYHPAALLRNASFKRPTWEDMQVVRDRLAG